MQRPDDTAEVVSNRLEIYHQQTEQVADYYRKEFNIYDIDADKEVDLITNIIFEKLDAIQKA